MKIVQLITAPDDIVLKMESGNKTVVAFALTDAGRVIPCVFGSEGELWPVEGDTNHRLIWAQ
jgi:predicted RNA-binding protein YlqC (UPF0109 family)